jgi:hypothetical protein
MDEYHIWRAVIFNPDAMPYASLANRAIEAAPSFGITVTRQSKKPPSPMRASPEAV